MLQIAMTILTRFGGNWRGEIFLVEILGSFFFVNSNQYVILKFNIFISISKSYVSDLLSNFARVEGIGKIIKTTLLFFIIVIIFDIIVVFSLSLSFSLTFRSLLLSTFFFSYIQNNKQQ